MSGRIPVLSPANDIRPCAPEMIPSKIHRVFRGIWPAPYIAMKGLIFAPLLIIQPNKFARIGWPQSRLTNLVNLKILN